MVRGCLDLCMFAENSEYQEEIVAVGDIGKIMKHLFHQVLQVKTLQKLDWFKKR